jgi:hypothetical protein
MIDLRPLSAEVLALVQEALVRFEAEHPGELWSVIGVDSAPVFGWLRVSFDTKVNSDALVAQFEHHGPDWYGEDQHGRFNDNCEDFLYPGYQEIQKPEWHHEFMERNDCFSHIDATGVLHRTDMESLGNDGFNALIFPVLVKAQRAAIAWLASNARNMDQVTRFVVQICDSEYCNSLLVPRVVPSDA